ncbi:helix-turn-helix domain-containing protein [Nonomuraea sp. NPDC049152]|uniref:helix-turn-helix domain-containing protein n=1 Tax=Nonomuraea sp. NPDC049152 TaxID=3154350 RepID=UPI0033E20551
MSETWTIGELARHAASELRTSGQQVNGRVREVPSERLIRWYATIGLLDPPLTRRGRVALYGRRHLLQLVAIKRMQAEGSSIAEIQAALTGATDTMLAHAAQLPLPPLTAGTSPHPGPPPHATPPHPWPPFPPSPAPPPATGETPAARPATADPSEPPDGPETAWPPPAPAPGDGPTTAQPSPAPGSVRPYPPPPAPTTSPAAPDTVWLGEVARPRFWARSPESGPRSWPVHGVRLAEGVTLLIDGASRTPSEADLEAVLAAAGPLLAVLEERRLHEGSAT